MNKTLIVLAFFFTTSALAEDTYIWEEVRTTKNLNIKATSKEAELLANKIKKANTGTTKNKTCTTLTKLLELDEKYDTDECHIVSKNITSDKINIVRICDDQKSSVNLSKTLIGYIGDYKITGNIENLSVETTGDIIIKKIKKCKNEEFF